MKFTSNTQRAHVISDKIENCCIKQINNLYGRNTHRIFLRNFYFHFPSYMILEVRNEIIRGYCYQARPN